MIIKSTFIVYGISIRFVPILFENTSDLVGKFCNGILREWIFGTLGYVTELGKIDVSLG